MSWLDNTVCCSISVHTFGISKQVKAADVSQYSTGLAEKVAEKQASVSKRILSCLEYKAITSRDGFAQRWWQEHSVPSLFRKGVYAVPSTLLDEWTAYLDMYQTERRVLIEDFILSYDAVTQNAPIQLGELYRAEDYPDRETVQQKFWVGVRYLELGVPGRLNLLNPEVFRRAQEDFLRVIDEGKAQVEGILCAELTELAQGLRSALQGLDDGTLKRFHDSHLEKIATWTDLFVDARNVTGYQELQSVAERLKALANGVDSDAVKKFSFIRAEVKSELDQALVSLKGMLETRPLRVIDLD